MRRKKPAVYGILFAVGLLALSLAATTAFWQVTGSEVRRSASEAAERRREPPKPPVDTTPPWQPAPEVALLDTLFLFRTEGRLLDALAVLERWLTEFPDDRPLRLEGARLSFEALRRDRGVFHYRRYLFDGDDRLVLREAVNRILTEMPPAESRRALATLLRVDDEIFTVRVGLARATAEAGDPVGADTLLTPIPPHSDPEVDALRLMVRRAQNPNIATATRWVSEYPEETLYRLVLARALSKGGQPGPALQHYLAAFTVDTSLALREEAADVAVAAGSADIASGLLEDILAREPNRERALLAYARVRARLGDNAGAVRSFERLMALNPDEARFEEARGVLFEVNDTELTLPLLGRLVAFRPTDDALRLRYAQDLERTQALPAAEAQYDTLLTRAPSATLLLARARLRSAQGNLVGALADAAAAEAREPSVDAALMQADIHRWRQERELSRQAYERALLLAFDDPRVIEGRRLLAVQRREALAFEPEFGSSATSTGLGDSDGFSSFSVRAQRGWDPLVDETVVIVAGEVRQATGSLGTPLTGFGADAGFARPLGRANLLARAGLLTFDGGAPTITALLELTRRSPTRSLRASLGRQPAYESLRAAAVLARDDVMSATTLLGSAAAQLSARTDVYVQADHTALGDGNSRSVIAGAVRRALTPTFSLLYTASAAGFGEGTVDYWSPSVYVTQGVGVDARRDQREGWSFGARLAPSIAWSRETAPGRPVGTQSAVQATLSGDATWRRPGWEVGAFAGFGQDRAGTYSAGFAGVRARMTR